MAANLFRITVDEPNYSRVLGEPVDIEAIRNLPEALRGLEQPRVWAIKPGKNNEAVYHSLTPNDGLVFYLGGKYRPSGEGMYVAIGRVGSKFSGDEESARELFRNIHAVRMFTVNDFEVVDKSPTDIERILGYKRHPQGPHRVAEEHYSSVDDVFAKLRS